MSDTSDTTLPNPSLPPPAQQGPTQMPRPLPFNPPQPGQKVADATGRAPRVPYTKTADMPGWKGASTQDRMGADPILAGMRGLPANTWMQAPGYPQMQDVPGIINGLATGFGQYASPDIANPMLRAGLGMQMITKDYIAGARAMIGLRRDQMLLDLESAAKNHDEQMRDYQEVYHLYAPEYKNGKVVKGNAEQFRDKLWETARLHHDTTLQNYLVSGDIQKAEEYLKWLGDNGNDLKKATELLRYRKLQNDVEKQEEARREHEKALETFKGQPPRSNAPTSMPDVVPPTPERGATPKEDDTPEDLKSDPDTDFTEPGWKPTAPAGGPKAPPAAEPELGAAPQPQAQQPVRLAQADTGTMSDAPPPGAQQLAQAAGVAPAPAGAVNAPADAPAPGTPGAPATRIEVPYKPLPSAGALQGAARAGYTRSDLIDAFALADVNGRLSIAQRRDIVKAYPELMPYIIERRAEFEEEFRKIQASNLKGDAVRRAIASWNPEFAAQLQFYVDGLAAPPGSAWQNPAFQGRVYGLGAKIDSGFNSTTYPRRLAVARSLATGKMGDTVRFIATAYDHGTDLMNALAKRPGYFARVFSNFDLGPARGMISDEDRAAEMQIETLVNAFNHELENALAGRGATIPALRQEAAETRVIMGDTVAMMDQVRSKMGILARRQREIEDGFTASMGTGRSIEDYVHGLTKRQTQTMEDMRRITPGSVYEHKGKNYHWVP